MQMLPACGVWAQTEEGIDLGSQEGARGPACGVRRGCLEDHGRWALEHEGFGPGRCPVASCVSNVVR